MEWADTPGSQGWRQGAHFTSLQSMLAPWDALKRGIGCPLCLPRADRDDYRHLVRKLRVSTLYLTRDQRYHGTCVLILDTRHAAYISHLDQAEWAQLSEDLWDSERALHQTFKPDHINVATLGNTVPHLHFGLIPRYKHDGRWGRPIWTVEGKEPEPSLLSEEDYAQMAGQILRSLEIES